MRNSLRGFGREEIPGKQALFSGPLAMRLARLYYEQSFMNICS